MSATAHWLSLTAVVLGISLAGASSAFADPSLTLSQTIVHPGSTIRVNGTGFGASNKVEIWLDGAPAGGLNGYANARGHFPWVSITLPASIPQGQHKIAGQDWDAHPNLYATAYFTVTSAIDCHNGADNGGTCTCQAGWSGETCNLPAQ